MNLRVTQNTFTRASLASIQRAQGRIAASEEQILTGRRINRPSDAPLDTASVQRLRSCQAKLEQYQRNIDNAQGRVESAASVLTDLSDLFTQAQEVCLSAANATTDDAERRALAASVDDLLQALVGQANAAFDGRYLFAGTADDAPPFEAVLDADGGVAEVAYHGNAARGEIQVGPYTRIQVGEPGLEAFGGSAAEPGAFDALIELRGLLLNTGGLSEADQSAALSSHVARLRTAQDRVIDAAARLGARSVQLESTRTTLENAGLTTASQLSTLEDTDLVSAALELQTHQTALEAAFAVSARMFTTSLLEYLQ